MEPKNNSYTIQSNSVKKTIPINIRFVSNSDKENISPNVILSQTQTNQLSPFSQINRKTSNPQYQSDRIMNPFETSIGHLSSNLMPLLLDNITPSLPNLCRSLKKTNSVSTFQSEFSDTSLRSIQNKTKGFSICQEDQERVLQDITHCFVSQSDHQSIESNSLNDIDFLNGSFSRDEEHCMRSSNPSKKLNMSYKENPHNRTSLIVPIKYKKKKMNSNKKILANKKRNTFKLR
jgi:hypothetical protein